MKQEIPWLDEQQLASEGLCSMKLITYDWDDIQHIMSYYWKEIVSEYFALVSVKTVRIGVFDLHKFSSIHWLYWHI
jgi:hypothetical protein